MNNYKDFDIDAAINPSSFSTPTCKLEGVLGVKKILDSRSNSTEEFARAASKDLGTVDRHVMYVNTMTTSLIDRLNIASKVARNVNNAKSHGLEGFTNVERMDPWEYAIEGKVGEFFKRIWEAIKTACRRVITAIANIIKWLGNVIMSVDVKSQVKDYEFYRARAKAIDSSASAAKTDSVTFNSLNWKVDASGMVKIIKKASDHYVKMFNEKEDQTLLTRLSNTELAGLKTESDFAKAFGKVFGIQAGIGVGKTFSSNRFANRANDVVKKLTD
jgi:hypothetical protein